MEKSDEIGLTKTDASKIARLCIQKLKDGPINRAKLSKILRDKELPYAMSSISKTLRLYSFVTSRITHLKQIADILDVSWRRSESPISVEVKETNKYRRMWDPVEENWSTLMEVIEKHNQSAKTSSAFYTLFPFRLMKRDLFGLVRDNVAKDLLDIGQRIANGMQSHYEVATIDHSTMPEGKNRVMRKTFMRASDVRKFIQAKDEYRRRTPEMARTFFRDLVQTHVIGKGYPIFFIEDDHMPSQLSRYLHMYNGITVIGQTLSLRRNVMFEVEIVEESSKKRLLDDIALMADLWERVKHKSNPGKILAQIREFQKELEQQLADE